MSPVYKLSRKKIQTQRIKLIPFHASSCQQSLYKWKCEITRATLLYVCDRCSRKVPSWMSKQIVKENGLCVNDGTNFNSFIATIGKIIKMLTLF